MIAAVVINGAVVVPALIVMGASIAIAVATGKGLRAPEADHDRALERHFGQGLDALGRASKNGRGPGSQPGPTANTTGRVFSAGAPRN